MPLYKTPKGLTKGDFRWTLRLFGWQVPVKFMVGTSLQAMNAMWSKKTKTCVSVCVCVHMKYEAGLRAFLTVSMWSHKSSHTHTQTFSSLTVHSSNHGSPGIRLSLWWQSHQGIVGYLSPPTYRQPAILDRWESGFVCSLSLPHSLRFIHHVLVDASRVWLFFWQPGCFPLCNGADPNQSYIRMAYQPTDIVLNNLHSWHFKHVKKF